MSTLCHANPFWVSNLRPERLADLAEPDRKKANKIRKRLYREWEVQNLPEPARGAHLTVPHGFVPLYVNKPNREKKSWKKILAAMAPDSTPAPPLTSLDNPFWGPNLDPALGDLKATKRVRNTLVKEWQAKFLPNWDSQFVQPKGYDPLYKRKPAAQEQAWAKIRERVEEAARRRAGKPPEKPST